MTLTLKPSGRGNWRTVLMQLTGSRAQPLLVKVGDRIPIGGLVFRVCGVTA